MDLEKEGEIQLTKEVGNTYYKMQDSYYDGNGVFFNQKRNCFSLSDKSKGPQYLAESLYTACHEFYQEEEFIDRSVFRNKLHG